MKLLGIGLVVVSLTAGALSAATAYLALFRHARLRLGVEADHEAQVFGQGINYFHFENLPWSHFLIQFCLVVTGLYSRGRRNAANITVKTNHVRSRKIPPSFDGFAILHVSDLHVDLSAKAMDRLYEILLKR